jgi:hypothetical protein
MHTGIIIGVVSILWSAHLVHLAIPIARGIKSLYISLGYPNLEFYTGNWVNFSNDMDKDENIFNTSLQAHL